MRPDLEVADVFHHHGADYRREHDGRLGRVERRIMAAVEACRTAALGGHVEDAPTATLFALPIIRAATAIVPMSGAGSRPMARRARPSCCRSNTSTWSSPCRPSRRARLPTPAPSLRSVFKAGCEATRVAAADPKHLGAEVGGGVLHTWGQSSIIRMCTASSRVAGCRGRANTGSLADPDSSCPCGSCRDCSGDCSWSTCGRPSRPASSISSAISLIWPTLSFSSLTWPGCGGIESVVYAKPPFGGPAQVLAYLGRYTHRVAIANGRLVSLEQGKVSFRWKDYRHHDKSKLMTLRADEFIRRFLLHALPDGFHRIRHYGLFANGCRAAKLAQCRLLLASPAPPPPPTADYRERYRCLTGRSLDICPGCGGAMVPFGPLRRAQSWPDTS